MSHTHTHNVWSTIKWVIFFMKKILTTENVCTGEKVSEHLKWVWFFCKCLIFFLFPRNASLKLSHYVWTCVKIVWTVQTFHLEEKVTRLGLCRTKVYIFFKSVIQVFISIFIFRPFLLFSEFWLFIFFVSYGRSSLKLQYVLCRIE